MNKSNVPSQVDVRNGVGSSPFAGTAMVKHFLAGSVGGLAGVVIGYPFDTIRVRLQTQSSGVYKSVLDCMLKIIKYEGVVGLYKGLSTPLVATTFLKAITFSSFGFFLNYQQPHNSITGNIVDSENLVPIHKFFIAGVGAGIVNSILSAPVDRAKIVLQLQMTPSTYGKSASNIAVNQNPKPSKLASFLFPHQSSKFKGPIDVVRQMGLKGMYKGLVPTTAREMIGCGTYFTSYELLTRKFSGISSKSTDKTQRPSISVLFLSGGLTGVITWTIMFPIDVIKSRVQSQTNENISLKQVIKSTYYEGGILSFYKGWTAAVMRALPAHAAILGTYELMIRFIGNE